MEPVDHGVKIAPKGGWTREAFERAAPQMADCLYLIEGDQECVELLRLTRGPEAGAQWRQGAWEPWDGAAAVARVGECSGMPVDVALRREVVRGVPVCFYAPASRVAHWGMIEKFLGVAFPGVPKTDPTNMGHFTGQADRLRAAAQARALEREISAPPSAMPKRSL